MGLTVGTVLEMARSQLLQPGGSNQETWDQQNGTLTSSSATMTLDGLAEYVAEGSIVEWDDSTMEAALVKSVAGAVVTFQERGFLDTTAAAHADNTRIIIDSVYLKKTLFDGLTAVISSLRGYGLYQRKFASGLTYVTSSFLTMPSDAIDTLNQMYVVNGSTYSVLTRSTNFEFLPHFSPPKVRFFGGGTVGAALTLPYKADFTLPQDAFDADTSSPPLASVLDVDLDDCGISPGLQRNLPLGIAAHVLSGRDIPSVDSEHVRRTQANAGIPVGTRVNLARTLRTQFESGPIQAEYVRLREANPIAVSSHERF